MDTAYEQELIRLTDSFAQQDADTLIKNAPSEGIELLMKQLSRVISYHNYAYYVLARPIIADVQYDHIFGLLLHLEETYPDLRSQDSPTQSIKGQVLEGFSKVKHQGQMLSLENTYSAEDIKAWCERVAKMLKKNGVEKWSYCIEPKYDGSSVEVTYKNGKFVQASTRGDSWEGEDVTEHIRGLGVLPTSIEELQKISSISFRAEAVMPKTAFEELNRQQLKEHQEIFANARNAVAGTLRLLDTSLANKRRLSLCSYDLLTPEVLNELKDTAGVEIDNQGQLLTFMRQRHLPVYNRSRVVHTPEELVRICEDKIIKKEFDEANILFDGLVIKINEFHLRPLLGQTNHHPRRAMAYKYPAHQVATQLMDITYQVGRTGAITPVAELAPISLGGSTIARATLHNFDFIDQLDVRKGDRVWLQKSGEVIPYIVGPIVDRRTGAEEPLQRPTTCPSCGTSLTQSEDGVALVCPSQACPAKITAQLLHFVSKQGMNIQGLGDQIVIAGVERGFLKNRVDIFHLTDAQSLLILRTIPGVAQKKILQLVKELNEAKKRSLARFLYALGIPFVGKKAAQDISNYLQDRKPTSIEQWLAYLQDEEALNAIYGVGKQTVNSLKTFMSDQINQERFKRAINLGVDTFFKWENEENLPENGEPTPAVGEPESTEQKNISSSDQLSLF